MKGVVQQFVDRTVDDNQREQLRQTMLLLHCQSWLSHIHHFLHLCMGIMNDRSICGYLVPPDALVARREADHV